MQSAESGFEIPNYITNCYPFVQESQNLRYKNTHLYFGNVLKTEIIFFVRTGHLSRFPYGGSIYKNNTYCGPPQHVRMPNVAIRPSRAPFQAPVIPACPPSYNFYPPFPPANQFAHPGVYMPPQSVFPNMEDNGYYKQMQQFEDGIPGRGPRYRNQFSRPKVQ